MYKKKLSNIKIKKMINISQMGQHLYKIIFHTGTGVLILLSVYPGNLIGLIFFGDDTTFP
jgi:phenolic acid decarboxylase